MTYHIWYKDPKGEEFKITTAWGDAHLETRLIDMSLENKAIYLILRDGKAISKCPTGEATVKQTVSCPHCGGVDAHRYDCKGGYGL